jgi:hypothetical protein
MHSLCAILCNYYYYIVFSVTNHEKARYSKERIKSSATITFFLFGQIKPIKLNCRVCNSFRKRKNIEWFYFTNRNRVSVSSVTLWCSYFFPANKIDNRILYHGIILITPDTCIMKSKLHVGLISKRNWPEIIQNPLRWHLPYLCKTV